MFRGWDQCMSDHRIAFQLIPYRCDVGSENLDVARYQYKRSCWLLTPNIHWLLATVYDTSRTCSGTRVDWTRAAEHVSGDSIRAGFRRFFFFFFFLKGIYKAHCYREGHRRLPGYVWIYTNSGYGHSPIYLKTIRTVLLGKSWNFILEFELFLWGSYRGFLVMRDWLISFSVKRDFSWSVKDSAWPEKDLQLLTDIGDIGFLVTSSFSEITRRLRAFTRATLNEIA